MNFSAGHLENDFNTRMRSKTAGFLNYTFYFRDSDASQDFVFGWANHNLLNIRHFEDAANFSPRFDYHTSFGPAISFRRIFGGPRFRLGAEAVAHFQMIGFMLQSAYVAGGPGGDGDGLRSLLDSATLFYPGKAWDWGMSLRLRYTLDSGNNPDGEHLEFGMPVDIAVDLAPDDEAEGTDTIIERAIEWLR